LNGDPLNDRRGKLRVTGLLGEKDFVEEKGYTRKKKKGKKPRPNCVE